MMGAVRIALGLVGAGLLAIGLAALASGQSVIALYPIVLGLVALGIALFEQARYVRRRGEADAPSRGLRQTDEVFVDPTTGLKTRVWVDPASGAREYRPES